MVRNEAFLITRRKRRWVSSSNLSDLVTRCRVEKKQLGTVTHSLITKRVVSAIRA